MRIVIQRRYYFSGIEKTENGQRRSDDQMQLAHKSFRIAYYLDVAILQKRQEQAVSNPRRDRLPQQSSDDNNKRRSGPANEKNGCGPVRSAQKK
ncbi:unnamed protein product [Rotaria magnacalcarata]|uniref:Uncharacterized protein n=1 Tax=Rotaria magnacalcarata TaxID=392030 RepID=A0A816K7R2_9BILA|nr:unnamed protein product [Rotaria magnacalcarata]